MKLIHQIKTLIRVTILGAVLALGFTGAADAAWNENGVGGGAAALTPNFRTGAYDPGYGVYWCVAGGKLWAVYWNGTAWTSTEWAANAASDHNTVAIDTTNHWVFYRGTDNAVWICYYTGSTWATAKVGASVTNNPRQFCCDPGYHVLWYVNGTTGYLWAVYHNGSAWVEVLIDGVNARYSQGRCCGVDEVYHFVWHMAADRRSLRYTYHNGSAWVSASPGILLGTDLYQSICADGPSHQVYNYQMTAAFVPTKMQSLYWTGSAWASWTCIKDGHLATSSGDLHCIAAQNSYSCYVADPSGAPYKVVFTNYSANARNWCVCRQDTSGYYALATGHGGRSVLCYTVGAPKILYSDL